MGSPPSASRDEIAGVAPARDGPEEGPGTGRGALWSMSTGRTTAVVAAMSDHLNRLALAPRASVSAATAVAAFGDAGAPDARVQDLDNFFARRNQVSNRVRLSLPMLSDDEANALIHERLPNDCNLNHATSS